MTQRSTNGTVVLCYRDPVHLPPLQALVGGKEPVGAQRLPSFRVLITAVPYAAHAFPLVRLGQELAGRGHQVWFGSSDDFPELPYGRQVRGRPAGPSRLPAGRQ
jgi:hypothetical protein